jgi:hypothetical protein
LLIIVIVLVGVIVIKGAVISPVTQIIRRHIAVSFLQRLAISRDVNFSEKSKAKAKRKRRIFKNSKRKRSESENSEIFLSESEAKRHGNFLSESEAKRSEAKRSEAKRSYLSLFSLFRFARFFALSEVFALRDFSL